MKNILRATDITNYWNIITHSRANVKKGNSKVNFVCGSELGTFSKLSYQFLPLKTWGQAILPPAIQNRVNKKKDLQLGANYGWAH